jgi:outer membrane receptor protein involved in Fe transport
MRIVLFIFLLASSISQAQNIQINVIDKSSKAPLIGATLQSNNGNAISDEDGIFSILVQNFPDTLTIDYLGYETEEIIILISNDIPTSIALESLLLLETMTVTASKYEKRLSESTVSVEVLRPELIANSNSITIDDALDKVSGVQMVDGQANIRGGSGFSYGAGSRVMLLVDDMPALQTDAGFPNWGDMPIENIDQVEIVKGASSALYGSAALNGIINIRTGTPTNVPQTKISAAYTSFGDPADLNKKWWGDTARYEYVLSAVHKQKFDKLDFVGSIFHYREESYNKATYDKRYRGTIKLKYRLSDKVFIGLNTLVNKGKDGDFFIWEYGDDRALNPIPGGEAVSDVFRYFIDPSLVVEDGYGNTHRINTRYHYINNINSGNQSNKSKTYYGEYQFQRKFEPINTLVTTGIINSRSNTDAELFGDTTFTTKVFAYYAQLERQVFDKLNLSGGIRYEYNEQLTPEMFNDIVVPNGKISAGKWIARLGASYEYMPFSSVRASWGQGYRFPTITERFITTTFGIFQVRSNPDLVPESGWTAEIGIKQGIKFAGFKGFLDAAIFTSEYEEMMEFTFGFSGFSPSFTSQNVGSTKINGFEISLFGTIDVGAVQVSGFGGYTFINPKYTNFEGNEVLFNSLSESVNVLKYRSKHNAKMDVQAEYKNFALGFSVIRSSHVINIDAVLEGRGFEFADNPDILGVKAYREANNSGWTRLDTRFSYEYKNAKLSFLINNLTNIEYTVRPALIEAPIAYSLRLDYVFDWE